MKIVRWAAMLFGSLCLSGWPSCADPAEDTGSFEITLPSGYTVDDLAPPADADFDFASYHSKPS